MVKIKMSTSYLLSKMKSGWLWKLCQNEPLTRCKGETSLFIACVRLFLQSEMRAEKNLPGSLLLPQVFSFSIIKDISWLSISVMFQPDTSVDDFFMPSLDRYTSSFSMFVSLWRFNNRIYMCTVRNLWISEPS